MVMNPRTHPRGAAPDFELPRPNPNPSRMTDALWWLVCMRLLLEPLSENGGTYANKAGYHNVGSALPDHGLGDPDTDHSIRRAPDRRGPHWLTKCSAHDWTFTRAHSGNYTEINKYTRRLVNAMSSLTDLRPDDVYAYTIGQVDGDRVVEGWNEYTDDPETGDSSHLWHRHDSFRRNIIGDFWAMWKALTIDMGWTYAEWQQSVTPREEEVVRKEDIDLIVKRVTAAVAESVTPEAIAKAIADYQVWNPYSKRMQPLREIWGWTPSASWHQTTHALLADLAELIATTDTGNDEQIAAIHAKVAEIRTLLDVQPEPEPAAEAA